MADACFNRLAGKAGRSPRAESAGTEPSDEVSAAREIAFGETNSPLCRYPKTVAWSGLRA